jgi:glycosyltransferase involved in cell wall biosynthesis
METRLAIVQHGDYREALQLQESGGSEPYAGMYKSIQMTEELIQGTTYRIISLDAPAYHEPRGTGELVGLSAPRWKKGAKLGWSWRAYRAVRAFGPTHILLRTGGALATPILRYAIARDLDVMVMLAGYVPTAGFRDRLMTRLFVEAVNHPCVFQVGNHRQPAADSLIAAGVRPEKVVAFEVPFTSRTEPQPIRTRRAGDEVHLAYVGSLMAGKGVGDVLEAAIQLNQSGCRTLLTICGDGPMMATLRERASTLPDGLVTFRGRVGNQAILELMERATFVCVASRRESSEGMPLVVTEGLSCRTPLLCSDHPCLTDILADGEGLRYFPSGDAGALAGLVREIANDPEAYARLSEATTAAYHKVISPILINEPIERWRAHWKTPQVAAPAGTPGEGR